MNVQIMSKRSMIVLVANPDAAPDAIRAASDLLDLRRKQPRTGLPGDEVLGVWCRPDFDGRLPIRHRCDSAPEEGLAVRESFALSGLWSLCWIDGPLFDDASTAEERRLRLLDALAHDATEPIQPGTRCGFTPVFEEDESSESIRESLQELRRRHPDLVRDTWLVDHCDHGLTTPEEF